MEDQSWRTTIAQDINRLKDKQAKVTVAILAAASLLYIASSADAQTQTIFNNPIAGPSCSNIVGCVPVDNCREFANNCGKPAADLFCQRQGYDSAISFHITNTNRTIILTTGQICEGPFQCGMFDTVTCKPAAPPDDCLDTCDANCADEFQSCLSEPGTNKQLCRQIERNCFRNCARECKK